MPFAIAAVSRLPGTGTVAVAAAAVPPAFRSRFEIAGAPSGSTAPPACCRC